MSFQSPDDHSSVGRKAIHVKWAGKTIALGTFPPAEAEEKCARAKALTRAWRSTMRPKPNREWVILELERLGVRVVSGSRARVKEADAENAKGDKDMKASKSPKTSTGVNNSTGGADQDLFDPMMQPRSSSIGYAMMDGDLRRRSSSFVLGGQTGPPEDVVMPPHRPLVGGASAAAYEAARADHYSSLAAKKGLSGDMPRRSSLGAGGMMGPGGLSGGAPNLTQSSNQHYEMLKLHHMNLLNEIQETTLMMNLYQQQQLQQQQQQLQEQERMLDTQGSNGKPQMKMSQQQQSDRGESMYGGGMYGDQSRGGNTGMMEGMGRSPSLGLGSMEGMMGRSPSLGLGSLDDMYRRSSLGLGGSGSSLGLSRASLGLGGSNFGLGRNSLGMGETGSNFGGRTGGDGDQQQSSINTQSGNEGDGSSGPDTSKLQEELIAQEEEQRLLEERLRKVRAEIAQRQREAEALEASFGISGDTEKRKSTVSDDSAADDSSSRKKRKSDTSGVTSCEI